MKKANENIKICLVLIVVILLIPILIDKAIIGNSIASNILNEQWVSFLGSYIGSILGGVLSVVGVFITIKYYKEQDVSNRQERENVMLSEIKKQHEIKYRFEYLEELEKINRTMSFISERISTIQMVIGDINRVKALSIISCDFWNDFKRLSNDLYKHYNNLKSIYECKLSVFYQSPFIKNIDTEIDGLVTLLSDEFNESCKDKTVEQFEQDLRFLIIQFEIEKEFNNIKDINEWIVGLKKRFVDYMNEFKKTI